MPVLTMAAALALAVTCTPLVGEVPAVSPDVILSIAATESALDPLTLRDNTIGDALHPRTKAAAIGTAASLISAGHSVDLGIMQVNSANLSRLGLTVATALDPCTSIRAGGRVLLDDYQGGATTDEQKRAILAALSAYNTGSRKAGLRTYAPAVLASARKVIPALRLAGLAPYTPPTPAPSPPPCGGSGAWHFAAGCPAPADWHVTPSTTESSR